MNSRHLAAVLLVLLIGMSCFLSTPVLSGEHPWDVDRTGGGGGNGGGSGGTTLPVTDTTRVQTTDGTASYNQSPKGAGFGSWYDLVSRLTVYFATQHMTTWNHGVATKGKAER